MELFSPVIVLLALLVFFIYKWITRNNRFFVDRDVPHKKPTFLFGHLKKLLLMKASFNDMVLEMYNHLPTEKVTGFFELMTPITMIRDPDLIKQIGVKDFQHFVNHRQSLPDDTDPLFTRNIFAMRGEKWRDMRATLSPAFTGSKMRSMFELVVSCSEDVKKYLVERSEGEEVVLEMKDLFTRFANDVIATCAFGIQVNSMTDPKNEFFEMGRDITDFSGFKSFKFFGYVNFPSLMKLLRVKLFNSEMQNFFRRVVMGNITYREEHNVQRPDMIQLLMQARKGKLTHTNEDTANESDTFAVVQEATENKRLPAKQQRVWEDDDLTAQCLIFFFAGFDTASTLLCFLGHELAVNPDIQTRLVEEVDQFQAELEGKPMNYDTINKMKYLDMVVTETLRKWPPAVAMDRVCTSPYTMKVDGKTHKFNVGDIIWFPVFGIHRDERYYPDPEKFDPERFNEENKRNIHPETYLPFGVGPRNCIGSRFALMETKAILYSLLSAFTFEVSEKTQVPLRLQKGGFAIRGEKGFWAHMKRREVNSK